MNHSRIFTKRNKIINLRSITKSCLKGGISAFSDFFAIKQNSFSLFEETDYIKIKFKKIPLQVEWPFPYNFKIALNMFYRSRELKTIWNHILKTSECDYVEFLFLDLLVSIRWSVLMVNKEVCRCRGRAPSLNASSCILVAISLSPSFVKNKKRQVIITDNEQQQINSDCKTPNSH